MRTQSALCGIDQDPFHDARKLGFYRPKFTLEPAEFASFPIPEGCSWGEVTLTEISEGALHISFEEVSEFAAWESGQTESHHIVAQDTQESQATFSLKELGLLTDKGQVNRIGKTLCSILRAGGGTLTGLADIRIVEVNDFLKRFFEMETDPIECKAPGSWVCRFEAGSLLHK